ncbi:RING finger and WD repeat domain-containing protein 2, partial [Coemansia sp. RSA 2603]
MDVTDQNQTQRHDGTSSSHQHDIDSTPSDTSVTTVSATSLDTTTTPATQLTHTTEASHLPVRSSVNRAHSVSSRTSPYPLSHNTSRHALPGEAANIPRTAQYHAVGMPARHPLGVQTDPMHSDVSSADSADGNGIDMEPEVLAALRSTREVVDRNRVESGRVGLVSLGVVSSDDEDEGNDNEEAERDDQVGAGGSTSAATAFGDDEARRLSQVSATAISSSNPVAKRPRLSNSSLASASHLYGCPICLSTIREAFMTACGHSFCFRCISRHLSERHVCPLCFQSLEGDQIFPNFALNKLITQGTLESTIQTNLPQPLFLQQQHHQQQQANQLSLRNLTTVEQIRSTVENGDELDADDIDTLLKILQQKKQSMQSYARQFEMSTMRQFLLKAQTKKLSEMEVLRKELMVVEEDLEYVSTQLDRFAQSSETFGDGALARSRVVSTCGRQPAAEGAQVPNATLAEPKDVSTEQPHNKRVEEHFNDLESFYFNTRMRGVGEEGLDEFLETLTTFARHERFRPVATLRYGDSTASTAIVASIEFDRDDDVFAVAGVTRKIKIYDYNNVIEQAEAWSELAQQRRRGRGKEQVMDERQGEWWNGEGEASGAGDEGSISTALQYPVTELTNRSKISCLSFNPYIKSQLACSDYDGT